MTKKIIAILIGFGLIFSAGSAFAGSANDTADYSITLTDTCIIDTTATTTDFGTHFIGDPNLTGVAAGSVTVTCANTVAYAWGVDRGSNPNGAAQQLRMANGGGQFVPYTLYEGGTLLGDVGMNGIDATYIEDWTGNTDRDGVGTGVAQTYNLTANINIGATAVAGVYNDTVTVTVVWP